MSTGAVGFTVKSGWAAVVLLGGSCERPGVLDVRRVELSDPAVPEARQPYHDGFGTARASGRELSRLVASVERFGAASVGGLIRGYVEQGQQLAGAGIVVGSLIDPERLGGSHVHIHALEGRLFRQIVEGAAANAGLACSVWCQRDLYARAAEILRRPQEEIRSALSAIERPRSTAWRMEQKSAALAAWLVLAGERRPERVRGMGRAARRT
ncbi:MAG TPA: hypothetical protein VK886_01140 [Vicinamibacterales bacterium]|nr:hypothetical protein [Vicinamibacterales bacterium]